MVDDFFKQDNNFKTDSNFLESWTTKTWQEIENLYFKERKNIQMQLRCKRLFDLAIASLMLIILAPIFLLIALAIKFTSPGPILFCQERLGKLGKPFIIYKFRTMVDGSVHIGPGLNTFKGDPRVTSIGKILREYHLDELPQLFNIIVGEMSLVGPRPLLFSTLSKCNNYQKRRLLMPPGLTAWEAVNGGLENDLHQRLHLDVWYVDNWNFWLDIVIILRTIPVVLRKQGIYEKENVLTAVKQNNQ
jgi:lipopolysaccharide/colanic/teichoic acid biosynthesis glycosyltransferase